MTIEFYKRKRRILAWRKDIVKAYPSKTRVATRKRLRIVKVKVVDSRKLNNAGGRKIGGRGRTIKKGEIGYVFAWRGMKKQAGLQRVR